MPSQQSHAERIAQFGLSRTGRTFRIVDKTGALAVKSTAAMTLEQIESWIGEHIKPGKSA